MVEALRAGIPVSTVYIASRLEADDRTREIISAAGNSNYPLLEVSRAELDRLTDGSVHQGVAIQVPPYAYADDDDLLDAAAETDRPALIVALDGVTDPRNLGAVLRSAGAFGAHGVLVPERRAAGVTASAWKVSAGAAARVPVARVTNLVRTLQGLKAAGVFVVGLDGGGDVSITDLPYATDPLVLVVGSEGKGLSRLVREQCDAIASIPIASAVESLNAGVAAGIALYEVARQRASDRRRGPARRHRPVGAGGQPMHLSSGSTARDHVGVRDLAGLHAEDRLLVGTRRQDVLHVALRGLLHGHVAALLLGQVPAVVQQLVVDLRGLELAAQVARDAADGRLEDLGQPVVRDERLVLALPVGRGAVLVEVVEQPAGLVLLHVEAGQAHEPAGVVPGVDDLRLDHARWCRRRRS